MILVISYQDEDHTIEVMRRLAEQGRETMLIDLADFPTQAGLTLSWSGDGLTPTYLVDRAGTQVDLNTIRVGWWRRIRPFAIADEIVDPTARSFAVSETAQAVEGLLDALPCTWVNPRAADAAAHHKPFQWAAAQEVGLRIPRTLVTNKPEAARRFIDEVGIGRTVYKAFLASLQAWRETRVVDREALEKLDMVRYAPVIFQEYVKGVDLRVTVVGETLFTAQIDAQQTSYPYDMRMVIGEASIQPITLPAGVRKLIMKLQRRLGLKYGAIDMRRTPEGEYIFLEVNPAGQWLFVEQHTGLAISQAVTDYLAQLEDDAQNQ